MPDDDADPDWSTEAVLDRLAAALGAEATASVLLFLSDAVEPDRLAELVTQAAAEAAAALGLGEQAVGVGRPLKLARSVPLDAPIAVIRAVAARPEIVAVLPSDVEDATVRPVGSGPRR